MNLAPIVEVYFDTGTDFGNNYGPIIVRKKGKILTSYRVASESSPGLQLLKVFTSLQKRLSWMASAAIATNANLGSHLIV